MALTLSLTNYNLALQRTHSIGWRRSAAICRPHRATIAHRRDAAIVRAQGDVSAPGVGLQPELRTALDQFVNENKVVLFMKGTKENPQCGFSATVCQILNNLNAPFVSVNILEDEMLRSGLKEYSSWPTFPQLYIDGEFYGGCDITIQAFQSGELQETLERALNS